MCHFCVVVCVCVCMCVRERKRERGGERESYCLLVKMSIFVAIQYIVLCISYCTIIFQFTVSVRLLVNYRIAVQKYFLICMYCFPQATQYIIQQVRKPSPGIHNCLSLFVTCKAIDNPDACLRQIYVSSLFVYSFSLSLCLQLAEMLKASLELGCFLAGVAISSQGPAVVDPVSG